MTNLKCQLTMLGAKVRLVLFGVLWLAFSGSLTAQHRGDQFLWMCKGQAADQTTAELEQLSYLTGLVDTLAAWRSISPQSALVCLPEAGISGDQATRIVVKWLEEHPKQLHETSRILSLLALRDAFPCAIGR